MIGVPSSPALDAMSADECHDLLATAEIGRVVLSIDALPAALPVNYGLVDDAIVFRTAPGTKLTAALRHTVVGFEVDEIDPATRSGWSVLVVGTSDVVSHPAEIVRSIARACAAGRRSRRRTTSGSASSASPAAGSATR